MIVGSGIDVIEIARVERALARHGERFLRRLLSPAEREACAAVRLPAPHVALCFAAKEAVMKAVGTGWAHGVRWIDIETIWSPAAEARAETIRPRRDETIQPPRVATVSPPRAGPTLQKPSDAPAAPSGPSAEQCMPAGDAPRKTTVLLRGRVAEIARERGGARCWLALSRSRDHAMAVALLEGDAP